MILNANLNISNCKVLFLFKSSILKFIYFDQNSMSSWIVIFELATKKQADREQQMDPISFTNVSFVCLRTRLSRETSYKRSRPN